MCSVHRHKINNSFWYRYAVFYFESDICSLLFSHKDFSLVLQLRYRLHTSRLHVILECTVVMVSACVRPQIMWSYTGTYHYSVANFESAN